MESEMEKFYYFAGSESYEWSGKKVVNYKGGDHLGYLSFDNVLFNDIDITNKGKEREISGKMKFILYNTTSGNMPCVIGLGLNKNSQQDPKDFIAQLKELNVINSYFWTLNYTSENEGVLIIGEQPHVYNPSLYHVSQLRASHSFIFNTMYYWGLRFDEIIFQGKLFRPYLETSFNYELNYIEGIKTYYTYLKEYLVNELSSQVCTSETIDYSYDPRVFFWCKKEFYSEKVKVFPSLFFYHKELNFTFELNYEDLWEEIDDKLVLKVFFNTDLYGLNWKLGKPFLKKYQFTFNQDNKIITFYNPNIAIEETRGKSGIPYVKIMLIFVCFFCLSLLISRFYCIKIRKRKVNNVEENYEYNLENSKYNAIN